MTIVVRELTANDEAAFAAVQDCDGGWCQCVAWWTPDWEGWSARTRQRNAALRRDLFGRGVHDGYLAFSEGEPVAWCQAGPRDQWPKLVAEHRLSPDPEVWAITCFKVVGAHRGHGVATRLLEGVLEALSGRGVRRVQAFPRVGDGLAAAEVWTGPRALYVRAGFSRIATLARREVWERGLG